MWGIIATWRMAAEGVEKAAAMLKEGGDAGDAIATAVREAVSYTHLWPGCLPLPEISAI